MPQLSHPFSRRTIAKRLDREHTCCGTPVPEEPEMPNPWPDPRDPEPDQPNRFRDIMVYFIAAAIGAGIIANVARGLMGMGWNW